MTRPRIKLDLLLPFLYALGIHAALAVLLLFGLEFRPPPPAPPAPPGDIVKAVSIDSGAVEKEIKSLQEIERQKRDAEKKRQKEAEDRLHRIEARRKQEERKSLDAKKQREETERKLVELRKQKEREQRKLEEQRVAERRKLAELKKRQQATEKKRKREEEAQRKLELEKQLAEEEKQRIEEEKRRLEAERKKEQERLEAERKERERLEAERKERERLEAERKERERLEAERLAQEQRRRDKSLIDRLTRTLSSHIRNNFNIAGMPAGITCKLRVQLAADGQVLSVNVTQSSGNEIFDRRAITAVQKSSPLPVPEDVQTFQRLGLNDLSFRFDPWR